MTIFNNFYFLYVHSLVCQQLIATSENFLSLLVFLLRLFIEHGAHLFLQKSTFTLIAFSPKLIALKIWGEKQFVLH